MFPVSRPYALAALAFALAFAGASPTVADPASGAPVDGVRCDQMEGSSFHIHQHLVVLDHGRPVVIPDDVGRPVVAGCFYWIHTHTSDGIIHIESPKVQDFTLGQFFDIWGQPLSRERVATAMVKRGQLRAYVGGRPFAGDPRAIALTAHADVVLEAGPPYVKPATYSGWGDL